MNVNAARAQVRRDLFVTIAFPLFVQYGHASTSLSTAAL